MRCARDAVMMQVLNSWPCAEARALPIACLWPRPRLDLRQYKALAQALREPERRQQKVRFGDITVAAAGPPLRQSTAAVGFVLTSELPLPVAVVELVARGVRGRLGCVPLLRPLVVELPELARNLPPQPPEILFRLALRCGKGLQKTRDRSWLIKV